MDHPRKAVECREAVLTASETLTFSIPASERTAAAMLLRESVRSVYIDMVYCPVLSAPLLPKEANSVNLPQGPRSSMNLTGPTGLITAWHNVTGKHPETGEYLGEDAVSPTHFRLTFLAPPPTKAGWQLTASPGNPTTAQVQMPISQYLLPLLREDCPPLEHPALGKSMDVVALSLARLRPNGVCLVCRTSHRRHVARDRMASFERRC